MKPANRERRGQQHWLDRLRDEPGRRRTVGSIDRPVSRPPWSSARERERELEAIRNSPR